jgi:hypothetical protein
LNTNGKQYIGSAKDLYLRLNEHLSLAEHKKKSNSALQSAIFKYHAPQEKTLAFVYINIFLAEHENKQTSHKLLTDLETIYILRSMKIRVYEFIQFYENCN